MRDIITIFNIIGHPDLSLTITYNTRWPEIEESIISGQRARDRADLCNRVFRIKHKILMNHFKGNQLFGTIVADVSVTEFQKRALENLQHVGKVICLQKFPLKKT